MREMCILRELEDCNASPILSLPVKINLTENAAGRQFECLLLCNDGQIFFR